MNTSPSPRNPFRRVVAVLWWVAFATFTAALLAWVAGRIASDRWVATQWLAWAPSSTPLVITTLMIGLVWALCPRLPRRRALRAFATLCWIASIAWFVAVEHRFLRADPTDARGLRIVHWTDDHPGSDDFDRVIDTMIAQRADITILSHPGTIIGHPRIRDWLDGESGVRINGFGIFTTLPIRRMERILREDDIILAYVQVDTGDRLDRPLNICLIDLPSDPSRSRADIAQRVREAMDEVADGLPGIDLVIGDANIPRGSWSLERMFPSFDHAFNQAGHGYGATYHRSFPLLHIDQFLLSSECRATDYDIIDPGFGRHRLHAATIQLNGESEE